MEESKTDDILEGTTRKVFRFIYRQHEPVGIHDVQRGPGLSSPSVAHYHIGKLPKPGLVKGEGDGYVVDKAVFENMIGFRKTGTTTSDRLRRFLHDRSGSPADDHETPSTLFTIRLRCSDSSGRPQRFLV